MLHVRGGNAVTVDFLMRTSAGGWLDSFWETRGLSEEDVQGWSCGSYGIIKSWLACMYMSQSPAGITNHSFLIRQDASGHEHGRGGGYEAPCGAG
jgi:hypothetical protein